MPVLQQLPLKMLSHLTLDIYCSHIMDYKELIIAALSKLPHVYLRNCKESSKLIEEMLRTKTLPKALTLKNHVIDSKLGLDTAVLMRKFTQLVYNERDNPLKFKIKQPQSLIAMIKMLGG